MRVAPLRTKRTIQGTAMGIDECGDIEARVAAAHDREIVFHLLSD